VTRLLLRPDAYYAETADGLYALGYRGPLYVKGTAAYPLLRRLAPYLDGSHTLDELTTHLTPERQRMVRGLIARLVTQDVIRELPAPVDAAPRQRRPARAEYRAEVAFLDHFHVPGTGAATFERFRDGMAVVTGSGPLLVAVAAAVVRSGTARLLILADTAEPTPPLDSHDEDQRFEYRRVPRFSESVLREVVADAAVVFHVGDEADLARAALVDRVCADARIPASHAMTFGRQVWLGRVTAARRRLRSVTGTAGAVTGVGGTLAAGQLVHHAFRTATGVTATDPAGLIRVDTETLDTTTHNFLPHPYDGTAAAATADALLRRIAALEGAESIDPADFSRRAIRAMGEHTGALGTPSERDFAQTPLHVCEIAVPDPTCPPGRPASIVRAIGAGPDFETARHRAALRAFAVYGARMADPRRFAGTAVWGFDLADREARQLDAARVFPPAPAAIDAAVGIAAGYDWTRALRAALLGHCRELTLRAAAAGAAKLHHVDLDAVDLDSAGDRYRAMWKAIGTPPDVCAITSALGVPTVACYRPGAPVAAAAATSLPDAIRDGLEQALLAYQSRERHQPAYAPPQIPEPPLPPVDAAPHRPPSMSPLTTTDIIAALGAQGHRAIAVPLDHDPEMTAIMPNTVHVVLDHD
jgi:hypothetical protein